MLHFKLFSSLMVPPPMPRSSTSVEGWGGVELPLAGLTPALFTSDTLSVDQTLQGLAVNTIQPTVSFSTSLIMVLHVIGDKN